jgi:Family of unknown function (DUF6146)
MSRSFFIGILALMVWACSPVKTASKSSAILTQKEKDTTEYGIVIIDPGFDQWYLLNYSPAQDRSNDYYRTQNIIAVRNWNDYYRTGKYSRIIDSEIDYLPDVDYGIDVNRKLFWYFRYIKSEYRIYLF